MLDTWTFSNFDSSEPNRIYPECELFSPRLRSPYPSGCLIKQTCWRRPCTSVQSKSPKSATSRQVFLRLRCVCIGIYRKKPLPPPLGDVRGGLKLFDEKIYNKEKNKTVNNGIIKKGANIKVMEFVIVSIVLARRGSGLSIIEGSGSVCPKWNGFANLIGRGGGSSLNR